MGTVNFYLKKEEPRKNEKGEKKKTNRAPGDRLIYLQYKYNGRKLVYSFGQNINESRWNFKKQRITNKPLTKQEIYINSLLDDLVQVCDDAYTDLRQTGNGIPYPAEIRQKLHEYLYPVRDSGNKETLFNFIERMINNEIKFEGEDRSYNTLRSYRTTLNHLKNFSAKNQTVVDFDTIDLNFYNKFIAYLSGEGLSKNSRGKEIKNVKTFMSNAVDLKLTTNEEFRAKKFKVTRTDAEAVYLKKHEIMKLYKYNLSDRPHLERVRDLFVFGCFVGLRISDFKNVKPENIIQRGSDFDIKIKTQKTGNIVTIPCDKVVKEIFRKYKNEPNKLPKAPTDQEFNRHIKEACRLAGMEETGRISSEPETPLYQFVKSHTARRSFATNLVKEGVPRSLVMQITGHKTEKSFNSYIKIDGEDAAEQLRAHQKKSASKRSLRVAS